MPILQCGAAILPNPRNITASEDRIRQWAEGIGDANPLYNDPQYGHATRWSGMVAPPGFESSMGLQRNPVIPAEDESATRKALRGWVADVAEKRLAFNRNGHL